MEKIKTICKNKYTLGILVSILFYGQMFFPFLSFIVLAPFMWAISKEEGLKKQIKLIAFLFLSFSAIVNYWMTTSFFNTNYYSFFQSIFFSILSSFLILSPLIVGLALTFFIINKFKSIKLILLFPLFFTLLKFITGGLSSFDLTSGFIKNIGVFNGGFILGSIGQDSLVFLVLLINCLIFLSLYYNNKKITLSLLLISSLGIECLGYLVRPHKIEEGKNINITAIRIPDALSKEMNEFDTPKEYLLKVAELIKEVSVVYPKTQAIILGENAIPLDMEKFNSDYLYFKEEIEDIPQPIILGAFSTIKEKQANLSVEFQFGVIKNVYTKRKLMPFGEYIPFGEYSIVKRILDMGMNYTTETDYQDYVLKSNSFSYGPIICYDAFFPDDIRQNSLSGELLLVLSNNAYSESSSLINRLLYSSLSLGVILNKPILTMEKSGPIMAMDGNLNVITPNKLDKKHFEKNEEDDVKNFDIFIPSYKPSFFVKHGEKKILFITILISYLLSGLVVGAFYLKRNS